MNKALTFVFIFMGTFFTVFLFNIVLYALVPSYHDTLDNLVSPDEEIPVVEVNKTGARGIAVKTNYIEPEKETEAVVTNLVDDEVALAASVEETERAASESNTATALQIIDKEYHEDCGTGEGYWVITYSDGSVGIE